MNGTFFPPLGKAGALLVVAALVMSGCTGSSSPLAPTSVPEALEAGTGGVSGVVTDTELVPIAGALVAIGEAPPTTTDLSGGFRVGNLLPGRNVLQVQALGYSSVARSVEVLEGEIAEVTVALEALPVEVPRTELFIFKGMSICDYMIWVLSGKVPPPACNSNGGINQFAITVNGTWEFLVAEMKWQGGFANSDTFRMFTADDGDCVSGSPCYGLKYGRGYIRLEGEPGDTELVKYYDPWTDDRGPGYPEVANGSFEFFLNAQWIGAFATELGQNPACQTVLQAAAGSGYKEGCLGVGVSTGIAFDAYVSIFYLQQPSPRGPCCPATTYSAIPDG